MRFAKINDKVIHYQVHGDIQSGPVIVFSNSLGTDLRIWDDVIALLPVGAFITYDKRGHGLSTGSPSPSTLADHVSDLEGLLAHLGVKSAIICGLSVGGMIAQGLAASRPDLVSGLILCDTAPKIGTAEVWNSRIAAIGKGGLASITDAVMERWFCPDFRQGDNPAYAGYRAMFERQPADGYISLCRAIRDTDFTLATSRISVPVLCVVGDQDQSTPPALVKAMAASIANARFVEIKDAGHLPCIEQPRSLASLIAGFIKEVEANGKTPVRHELGMRVRRAVLGDAHVDRAEAAKTEFDKPFQSLITEAAWGTVWSRPHWTRRERSMVTIALLAALGHDEEVAMHVRATLNTGASRDDITEALLHVAIYAGVPAANRAIKIAKQVYQSLDQQSAS